MLGISGRFVIPIMVIVVMLSFVVVKDSEAGTGVIYYTVRQGDTLFDIGEHYQVAYGVLAVANGIEGDLIFPGQILSIPVPGSLDGEAVESALSSRVSFVPEDLLLLAQAIHAEARGESFAGKVAVGAVVLNRLSSPFFPKTLRDVIFERTNQVYQFSPVGDGSINLKPNEESILAAATALSGQDPTGGALFFYNPKTAQDRWIRSLPVVARIGNHVFCR